MTSLLERSDPSSAGEDAAGVVDALLDLLEYEAGPRSAWILDAVDVRLAEDRCVATVLGRWRTRGDSDPSDRRRTVSVFRRRDVECSWTGFHTQAVFRCATVGALSEA